MKLIYGLVLTTLLGMNSFAQAQESGQVLMSPVKISFELNIDEIVGKSKVSEGYKDSLNSVSFQTSFTKDLKSEGVSYVLENVMSSNFMQKKGPCQGSLGKNYNSNENKFYFYGAVASTVAGNEKDNEAHRACLREFLTELKVLEFYGIKEVSASVLDSEKDEEQDEQLKQLLSLPKVQKWLKKQQKTH